MNTNNNPAAAQGWVKSIDPKSGKAFYANHITRKTQWDPPEGWMDSQEEMLPPPIQSDSSDSDGEESLPSNWEVMHDPTTGKPFYVDHARQITQWQKPTVPTGGVSTVKPQNNTNSSLAMARILQEHRQENLSILNQQTQTQSQSHSYFQPSQRSHEQVEHVDFSDALPLLEFQVEEVADALRLECPQCDSLFTRLKRRHHCRLCGDVVCHECSKTNTILPLPGKEFEKEVRICDACHVDVEQGNYFSLRRYLVPLSLMDETKNATQVNAALCSLTTDIDQWIAQVDAENKLTSVPPQVLMDLVIQCLNDQYDTADRSVRCLASLLTWASVTGMGSKLAHAVYHYGKEHNAFFHLLKILERSSTDRRTLFVQEQAAKALFYLTEPSVLSSLPEKKDDDRDYGNSDDLDLPHALRNVLDHATTSSSSNSYNSTTTNPNLQRWAAACVRHLMVEDVRRATLAANEVAAKVASGEPPAPPTYTSQLIPELQQTGGIVLLCSLVGSPDADLKAHATAALGATLEATRALDNSSTVLYELTAGLCGSTQDTTTVLISSIVESGGCGASVAQLLLSADDAVAQMGCDFLASLVLPLLQQAPGCATLPKLYDWTTSSSTSTSSLDACRQAAVALTTSQACLPALASLVSASGGTRARPLQLRLLALQVLACTTNAVCGLIQSWQDHSTTSDGSSLDHGTLVQALHALNQERVWEIALELVQQNATLGLTASTQQGTSDTPALRFKEGAGIILGAVCAVSKEALQELNAIPHLVTHLIQSSHDGAMLAPSTLRGDAAPKCLGLLEATASLLSYRWQTSGTTSDDTSLLLDPLLEALDAGVISFLFASMSTKLDWDSRDKSSGGMKARSAACRLVACLFGMAAQSCATTEKNNGSIGMTRLLQACDQTTVTRKNKKGGPRNILEATLTVLQYSLNQAHKVIISGNKSSENKGPHYQAALLDLVEAALHATASLCGSSSAPGGGGTLMTTASTATSQDDKEDESLSLLAARRAEVCKVACDIVIRGSLLPTLLVGGLGGEASVAASLRLSLAIAEHGSPQEHAKLANAGILVPISDALKGALASGDLYQFSAALRLIKFCGPYVAAGRDGGVQSVRDAIQVATHVLVLPASGDATQEALKSECISALESLSKNAALWSSISSDALPAIVTYLSSATTSSNSTSTSSPAAALRAIQEIVQVPSHAVAAAQAGLAQPLGRMLLSSKEGEVLLALQVLEALVQHTDARRVGRLLETGVLRSVCAAVASTSTSTDNDGDGSMVCVIGMKLIHQVLQDMHGDVKGETAAVLQSAAAMAVLDTVASEPILVQRLCATLLPSDMQIQHYNEDEEQTPYQVPNSYGDPLPLVKRDIAGSAAITDTHQAAHQLLYTVSVLACAIDSKRSDLFWKSALLLGQSQSQSESESSEEDSKQRASSTFCAYFLKLLGDEPSPFTTSTTQAKNNKNNKKTSDFETLTRPLVQYKLLEVLQERMKVAASSDDDDNESTTMDPYLLSVLVQFNVPHICLSVWHDDPALLQVSYQVLQQMVAAEPDEVLHLFVASKDALLSLFDLLNMKTSSSSSDITEIRRFLADTLGKLAQAGMLTDAVEKFGARTSAIAALAAAVLTEETLEKHENDDDEEELTGNRMSSGLMQCLVQLCMVSGKDGEDNQTKMIRLSSVEAESIARSLGTKICQMVITRFLERAKLEAYEIDHVQDDEDDIMAAPDIAMLCALAQHDKALQILRSIGGLHALAQVASEGELSAIQALQQGCQEDPSLLLEADTYLGVMMLFAEDKEHGAWREDPETRTKLESAAYDLLAQLCVGSVKGQKAVASAQVCGDCVSRALQVLSILVEQNEEETPLPPPMAPSAPSAPEEEEEESQDDADTEEKEAKEDQSEGDKEEPALADEEAAAPTQSKPVAVSLANVKDTSAVISAYSFLTSLAQVSGIRNELLNHDSFVVASSALASETSYPALQFEAIRVLSKLAPFVASGDLLSIERVGEILESVLQQDPTYDNDRFSRNGLHLHAATGLLQVFGLLPASHQVSAIKTILARFTKLLKTHTVLKPNHKTLNKGGGALAYQLTTVLLLAQGNSNTESCMDLSMATQLLSVVQWRFDPKTTSLAEEAELIQWDATVAQALQIVSFLLMARSSDPNTNILKWVEPIKRNVVMVARPGKAPRQAIPLLKALDAVKQRGEAASKVPAQRILSILHS